MLIFVKVLTLLHIQGYCRLNFNYFVKATLFLYNIFTSINLKINAEDQETQLEHLLTTKNFKSAYNNYSYKKTIKTLPTDTKTATLTLSLPF